MTYTITASNAFGSGMWEGNILDNLNSQYVPLVPNTTTIDGVALSDGDVWMSNNAFKQEVKIMEGEERVIQFRIVVLAKAENQAIQNIATSDDPDMSNSQPANTTIYTSPTAGRSGGNTKLLLTK